MKVFSLHPSTVIDRSPDRDVVCPWCCLKDEENRRNLTMSTCAQYFIILVHIVSKTDKEDAYFIIERLMSHITRKRVFWDPRPGNTQPLEI